MAFDTSGFTPETQDKFNQLVAAAKARGIDLNYNSGSRTYQDQQQLYANWQAGRAGKPLPYPSRGAVNLAAKPGTSPHEFGVAFDISPTDPKRLGELNTIGQGLGLKTIAGDPGHFQLADWKGGKVAPDAPATQTASSMSTPVGTTINASNAPVAGALAKPEVGPESAGASAAPGPAQPGQPMDTRQLVYNKLTGAGLQPHQALGVIWSLAGESGKGLDPTSYNPNDPGGSVGIGQWQGPRRAALEAFAKARGTAVTDPNTQADFLVDELTNKDAATYQPGVFTSLQGAKTPEDATKIWTSQFERPTVDNSAARIKGGTNVASLDQNGNLVLGAGGGGTTPSTGTAVASNAPAAAAAPQNQSWLDKIIKPPTDAQGNPIAGAQSPLQQLAQASDKRLLSEGQTERQESPQQSMQLMSQAHNVSPLYGSIPQTYGQTLNSIMQPATWTSRPGGAGGMRVAGLQGGMLQTPGVSLNSVPAMSQGLGYGIDDVGFGYG